MGNSYVFKRSSLSSMTKKPFQIPPCEMQPNIWYIMHNWGSYKANEWKALSCYMANAIIIANAHKSVLSYGKGHIKLWNARLRPWSWIRSCQRAMRPISSWTWWPRPTTPRSGCDWTRRSIPMHPPGKGPWKWHLNAARKANMEFKTRRMCYLVRMSTYRYDGTGNASDR